MEESICESMISHGPISINQRVHGTESCFMSKLEEVLTRSGDSGTTVSSRRADLVGLACAEIKAKKSRKVIPST